VSKLLYFVLFIAIAFGCCYGAFLFQKSQERLPLEYEEFNKFFPAALKKQGIWLAVAALAEIFGGFAFGFIVLVFAMAPWLLWKPGSKKINPREFEAQAKAFNETWLTNLGATYMDRAKAIEAMFEQKSANVAASEYQRWSDKVHEAGSPDIVHYIYFTATRNLAVMSYREREALRFAEHLNSLANGQGALIPPNPLYGRWRTSLVWGDGNGQQEGGIQYKALDDANPIKDYMTRMQLNVPQVINAITIHAGQMGNDSRQPQEVRDVCRNILERMVSSAA
jgi:hypothetical protein